MPRVKCTRCYKTETISKAGFVRGKQRFFCKECNYHFMLAKDRELEKSHRTKNRVTTIMDIAKIVGVSESTVSRALKDHEDISAGTKAVIKKIAEELNYQPNTLARSLTQRETRTIGVIIPDIETNFFASILTGIQNKASAAGYKVMISQSRESHLMEVSHTHAFMNNWVDGLLICHSKETQSFDHIKMYARNGIPIIQFDRVCDDLEVSKVLLDDENGAFLLTEHLIQQNCRRIMLVTGPDHLNVCKKRLEGYKKALKKYKIPFDESLLCRTDLSIASILNNVDRHLEFDRSVDSIFCISDIGAIHIILHLKKKGVKIPGDICIVGFGNEPVGEMIEPSLTTFNQHTVKFGETVAQLFFDQLIEEESFVPKTKIVRGSLLVRQSSCRL
jgi:Transcriptional regulators